MGTLKFYDAAYPLSNPPSTDGTAGYIGGDTPHVWSAAEWAGQKARYRLPVYVRSNPPGPGAAADVAAAVSKLKAIGAPAGTLVAWDMETAVDPAYISEVYTRLTVAGYKMIVYGSLSVVKGNRNPSGLYWGAAWDGSASLEGLAMHQYASNNAYDLSEADSTLPLWDTLPAPKPPAPTPTPTPPKGNGVNVTTLPPGNWDGVIAVVGKGTDGSLWVTTSSDGIHWGTPFKLI